MFGEYPATKIIDELSRDNLLPAILFRTSRRQCDTDIESMQDARGVELLRTERSALKNEIDAVIQKYALDRQVVENHQHYSALMRSGAGAHHAGQLLMWRLLLEELMSRGVMRLMVATGTVAAGVDFPARTVVVTAHSKRGSEGFNILTATELQQMSGRAGRRGKDSVGICLVAPSKFSDARVVSEVIKRPPEPLRSAYYTAPSTVLNLLKFRNVDDLRYTVSRSLASFLDRKSARSIRAEAQAEQEAADANAELKGEAHKKTQKRIRRKIRDAELLEARQELQLNQVLLGLETLGYLHEGGLTRKGYWAAGLCTTYVLELAEAIEQGLFYDLGVVELVGLAASISGDAHRSYYELAKNPVKPELFERFAKVIEEVQLKYPREYAAELKVLPQAALTVLTWMEAKDWAEFSALLRLAKVAEGDVARLVTQTADHLNQLCKLHESHPDLARSAAEARRMILKPPLSEVTVSD